MDQLAMEIGSRIKQARGDMGLTQEDVAKRLRIGRAAYSNIENGHSLVTVEHLLNLSRLFHRPVDYFLGTQGALKTDEAELVKLFQAIPAGVARRAIIGFVREWAQTVKSMDLPELDHYPTNDDKLPDMEDLIQLASHLDTVELTELYEYAIWRFTQQHRRPDSSGKRRKPYFSREQLAEIVELLNPDVRADWLRETGLNRLRDILSKPGPHRDEATGSPLPHNDPANIHTGRTDT